MFAGMFSGGFLGKAGAVAGGAIGAHIIGNLISGSVVSFMPTADTRIVKPITKLVGAGATAWVCKLMGCSKPTANLVFLGGVASVLLDVYNEVIAPNLPASFQGYGDYVQMPYSGYGTPAQVAAGDFGDYVQMPYSGYGTPAQVAAGDFGGYGGSGEMATFGPTF